MMHIVVIHVLMVHHANTFVIVLIVTCCDETGARNIAARHQCTLCTVCHVATPWQDLLHFVLVEDCRGLYWPA